MQTYAPRGPSKDARWYLVDADGKTLGRLATAVAMRLRGKHRPTYAPNYDHGDHVVVVNASKVVLTGKKKTDKMYRRHTGYPGGLKEIAAGKLLATRPERVIESAVQGMLPKNSLGRKLILKLKVYSGPEHPHAAQKPEPLAVPGLGE
ncbi:MAG TPA: 50S ribosomal protein L13 [Candidatus Polarisedimenticolia bacterium]|nr:50S ribosomal protein L13 [Candidatus Polarisedimenticolia bacterium]